MLNDTALDTLFYAARTHNGWQPREVGDAQLEHLFDLLKWAPTAANSSPARLVFVKSAEAKARLLPCMAPGNQAKVEQAPVTVIVGMDMEFYEKLPQLSPAVDARAWFVGNEKSIADTAFRNSSLQGAYLIMAARAIGLDCGPMSGFDADKLNAAFFDGTPVRANFVCSLGYGEPGKVRPRAPRLSFAEACRIV
ncbi:malonic semialdehyde reductase [Rugamonas sp. CCM 8940]|uniref:malonic semialdehyde reductase n=1 Tax=Rugamonas sp. CCM 8940 TaxID=2765359 RepID=UPI0018F34BF2|nr:malonic semialdehyde reductase [Rugamonas sp. CCM 8940]MBJ7311964.1 malonic semialdehyde reductase [Rugamonas sp. CCM 8940]